VDISFTFFVYVFVCTVTDFFAKDEARGVNFFSPVHRRPRQGITHFVNFAPPEAQNRTNRPARVPRLPGCKHWEMRRRKCHARDAPFVEYRAACGRRIDMCGYRSVPTDVLLKCL